MEVLESNRLQCNGFNSTLNLQGTCLYSYKGFEFNQHTAKSYERYGGFGAAGHGGGARSVMLGTVQLKGVGVNPLCGEADFNHSHGTLTLSDAVYEVIYSEILNNILPLGTVTCRALYWTNAQGAYQFSINNRKPEKTHGALLARDNVGRPAGLLRAREYEVPLRWQQYIPSDVERMRQVYDELHLSLGSKPAFLQFIGQFLSASAEQFGFARMAGIYHGAVTPSNMSLKGQWLDLATTTFVDRGKNYLCNDVTFFQEADAVNSTLTEILLTYSKYRYTQLHPYPLTQHYVSLVKKFEMRHCGFALGLKRSALVNIRDSTDLVKVYGQLCEIFFPVSKVYVMGELADEKSRDWVAYLIAFYRAVLHSEREGNQVAYELCNAVYKYEKRRSNISFLGYFRRSAVKAFKRAILTDSLHSYEVRSHIEDTLDVSVPEVSPLIEQYKELAKWLFCDDFLSKEVIFDNARCRLEYDTSADYMTYTCKETGNINAVKNVDIRTFTHPLIPDTCLHLYLKTTLKLLFEVADES